jgi:TonB family protein
MRWILAVFLGLLAAPAFAQVSFPSDPSIVRPRNLNPVPPPARRDTRLRTEGDVVLSLCIDASGAVTRATVAASSGDPQLDQDSQAWARLQTYSPATKNGAPIAICDYPTTFQWRIPRDDQQPAPAQVHPTLAPVTPEAIRRQQMRAALIAALGPGTGIAVILAARNAAQHPN